MPVRVAICTLVLTILSGVASGCAQARQTFCAAAQASVKADRNLAEAVAAAFGAVAFTSKAAACTYPLTVLRYASAEVLITQENVPGEACHGCAATLSAAVLRGTGGGLKLVKRLPRFAQSGTSGATTAITALTIGGDDGLAVESGGTFQGYAASGLDVYAFQAGRLVHLAAEPPISLSADDGGAMTDDTKAVSVIGSWSIDPARNTGRVVDYKVTSTARTRTERVVWTLNDARLVLSHGHVPPEVETASGRM